MEKAIARREVNRRTLDDYILDESERFEILGPGRTPLHRSRREFTWYVRDGMHVRSPVRFNGVIVGEQARQRYEADWIHRERERRERNARNEKERREEVAGAEDVQVSGAIVPTEPRFVSEAYFLEFKFEPGNYYLAGHEQLDGHDVLRIEYYPTRMFGDDDRGAREDGRRGRSRDGRSARDREEEQDIQRKMNRTALITLWVDPAEYQIVKYTFENVWLDFLPGAWLVRMDEIRASMIMGQPFPGVWLPREMEIGAGVTLANGSFEAAYERAFADYRLAEVETTIGVPRPPRGPDVPEIPLPEIPVPEVLMPEVLMPEVLMPEVLMPEVLVPAVPIPAVPVPEVSVPEVGAPFTAAAAERGRGPLSAPRGVDARTQEVVREIRVHGNVFLTEAEVLQAAGVAVGDTLGAGAVAQISTRLQDSRLFETVEVRRRFRSLTDTSDIALVLVVHERPGVRSASRENGRGPGGIVGRTAGRLRSGLMFLPIISFADGYGFTYGGRVSTVDLLGAGERLSVPLTWGATRGAALEAERLFTSGPLTRVDASVGIWSRENPRFELREQRIEVQGRAERVFADVLRAGVDASRSTISFGALDDRLWTAGTSVTLDTRADPAFPANAVLLGAGWTGLHFTSAHPLPGRVNRYTADARGYLRLVRQIVFAARAQYTGADAVLPPYERLLLGGSPTLRGFRTGAFDGDRRLVTSAELRVPVTSILSGTRLGLTAFVDAGRTWDHGQAMSTSEGHLGAGGGLFLIASIVRINIDVARGLKTGGTRVHLSSGFAF